MNSLILLERATALIRMDYVAVVTIITYDFFADKQR